MKRKLLLCGLTGWSLFALAGGTKAGRGTRGLRPDLQPSVAPSSTARAITLFLAGDVMTGRGIDQILPHPSDPAIYEPYMQSARGYVELAEEIHGPFPQPVPFAYVWGDALEELERVGPDVRLVNLETSVTTSDDCWPGKGIHYRMHPANAAVLAAAKIDCCSLANNHVLDWGYRGLTETLTTLRQVEIRTAGAGEDIQQAETPAAIAVAGKGRAIVFSYGLTTSGIPFSWGAAADKPGVNLLADLSELTVRQVRTKVEGVKQQGDVVVASIHWGGNWGYDIPPRQREFAHKLIDEAGVDVIHGHSSHHPKGIEVYRGKLILYGAGDFVNDYEGIGGYEYFRDDLSLMYFAAVDPAAGKLVQLQMTPMQVERFQVRRAKREDARWLSKILTREGQKLGTRVTMDANNRLTLQWI